VPLITDNSYPLATELDADDVALVVQDGEVRRAPGAVLQTWIGASESIVRAIIAAYLGEGANISIDPNGTTGQLDISATGSGGGGLTLDEVLDEVGDMFDTGVGIDVAYNSTTNRIMLTVTGDQIAAAAMETPLDPQPGWLRWNPDADPPIDGGGTGATVDAEFIRDTVFDTLQGSGLVTITEDDLGDKIIVHVTAQGTGGGSSSHHWLDASKSPYLCGPSRTPAQNTAGAKACITDACLSGRNAFFPSDRYYVTPGCMTPTFGINAKGVHIIGEGPFRTVFMPDPSGTGWGSPAYMYDNIGNPTTLSMPYFIDLGFTGGPTDTSTQRISGNNNVNFLRLQGLTDQSFRFERVRIASMNHCFHTIGDNNADVSVWINCRFMHINGDIWRLDNHQSVNMNVFDSPADVIWGNVVHSIDSDGLGGGGAVNWFGGHIIVQRHDAARGSLIWPQATISANLSFHGTRVEVRDDAWLVKGGGIKGSAANIAFMAHATFCTATTGTVEFVDVDDDMSVYFSGGCSIQTNGSVPSVRVRGAGRVHWDGCPIRSDANATTTVESPGTGARNGYALATNAFTRFAPRTLQNWSK
jgi:hypothetical protein